MTTSSPDKKTLPYGNKGDLTNGPLDKHLIRLSVPMIWGIGAIVSFQLVDTFFVSLLGTQELAAISFTFPLGFFIFSFIMGFGIAMSSVLSRLIGAKDQMRVKCVTTHGLILVFLIGATIAALGLAFQDSVFRAMGADEEMITLIKQYMTTWFAGAVFITTPLVGNAAIRATGDTRLPAMIMGIVALVNVILDPIFIFGLFGFPRLELFGAALATVIANALAALVGIYVIVVKKKMLCGWEFMHPRHFWDSAKRLLFIALPVGLTNSIQPIVNGVIIGLLSAHGASAVAAYGVVSRIEAFSFIILMALAVGMAPIVGQNWGAKNYQRVKDVLRLAITFSVIWTGAIAAILIIFARPIAELFSSDPQVIDTAVMFFQIVAVSYVFANLIRGWASAFNAMGKPQRSVLMIIVELLVLMLPGVYIGNHYGGITGIFIAMAAVNIVSGLGFHIWNRIDMHKKCAAS